MAAQCVCGTKCIDECASASTFSKKKRDWAQKQKKKQQNQNLKLKNNKKIKIFKLLLFVKKPPTCSPTHIRHPKRPQK